MNDLSGVIPNHPNRFLKVFPWVGFRLHGEVLFGMPTSGFSSDQLQDVPKQVQP